MASIQDLLVGIQENVATDQQTAATATATQAAPGTDKQLVITGFSISTGGAGTPTAALASIRHSTGSVVVRNFQIPPAFVAPIIYEFKRPISCPTNVSADITCGTMGAGITVRLELVTITRPAV